MNPRRALLTGLMLLTLIGAPRLLVARGASARHSAQRARDSLSFALDGAARLARAAPPSSGRPAEVAPGLDDRVQSCIAVAGIDASLVRDLSLSARGVRTTLSPLRLPEVGALLNELRRSGLHIAGLELSGIARTDQLTLTLSIGSPPAR